MCQVSAVVDGGEEGSEAVTLEVPSSETSPSAPEGGSRTVN